MQTSYQEYNTLSKSRPVVLNSPATNDVRNTYLQPNLSSEVGKLDKTFGENYNFKRVYSPYLSPSHLAVEQMTTSQSLAPLYVHNVARTKYFNVSRPTNPSEHNKVNLYAWSIISNGLNSILPRDLIKSLCSNVFKSQSAGILLVFRCLFRKMNAWKCRRTSFRSKSKDFSPFIGSHIREVQLLSLPARLKFNLSKA